MRFSVALILAAAPAVWAADPVPMNLKTGQWEVTVTMQNNGAAQRQMPQIPPEQLAKLPPEQRARIEAMLAQAGGAPRTTTSRSCVKKEDLTKLPLQNDQNCKTTLLASSPAKQEIRVECDRNGAKQSGTMTIEAVNAESVKFSVVSATSDAGKGVNMSMNMTGTSKWLGPVCVESK